MQQLRVWQRQLSASSDGVVEVPLRFRVVPGVWPDIELADAEGTISDVSAPAHEVRIRCDPGALRIDVGGFVAEIEEPGPLDVGLLIDGDRATLTLDDGPPRILTATPPADVAATAVTDNVSSFTLRTRPASTGRIELGPGVQLIEGMVYGLRVPESELYRRTLDGLDGRGALFYDSPHFSVHDRAVTEAAEGEPDALVPDSRTIVSPVRVVEEFAWRDTPYGDMTRVVDRRELWRSVVEPGRFPELSTAFRTVDAAFELALETFQRTSSDEFALAGESGMWSAGYFQGSGLGFGVWKRDTSHIALRSGNLLDGAIARASLAYVVNSGFDNGSDGDSLPAVAVWDYYLATGDASLPLEVWDRLSATASALDARFDESRGLVRAAQATSNDCFDEPEAGGFALSTEVYSMQTYAALAELAALPGVADPRGQLWADRASAMKSAIVAQYWNPGHGFFTSGPVGSSSYADGNWETSGSEAALWGFLGAEAEPMTESVLARMRDVAMSEYGVVLFPYRPPENHFCGSVWYCWQAGIARAAARVGDAALVHQLIAQQVRTVVRNKAFYEVTEANTGESWRWPGQLWHAAGFVSLVLFGLLGIRYDTEGMTFAAAVVPEFAGARIRHLRYRDSVLDIEIRGHGTHCDVTLDGQPVDRIAPDTTGHHIVVLAMR